MNWTAAKDKLPNKVGNFLVWIDTGAFPAIVARYEGQLPNGKPLWVSTIGIHSWEVTHWMEITPPEGERDG